MVDPFRLALAKSILSDLVAFPSISQTSNEAIADHIAGYLADHAIEATYDWDEAGRMTNLFATIGPGVDGGTILCGHMDVVPADPTGWSADPFTLVERDGRLHGRGAVDMKGFLAMVLASVPDFAAARETLKRPIHIAFTFDEETYSIGARQMMPFLKGLSLRPAACIIGEPTQMRPIVGHKGGMEFRTVFHGKAGHASTPASGVNTIFFAARLVEFLRCKAATLAAAPRTGSPFDPPCTTISVGRIEGGEARNIIADTCTLDWEIRPLPDDDGAAILDEIKVFIDDELVPAMRAGDPAAGVVFTEEAVYPGLCAEDPSPAYEFVKRVWDVGPPEVVAFGTDAGYLQQAGIPCIVIGPGNLEQAHQADEYIELDALAQGLEFIANVLRDHQTRA